MCLSRRALDERFETGETSCLQQVIAASGWSFEEYSVVHIEVILVSPRLGEGVKEVGSQVCQPALVLSTDTDER
jgi:hypothetical protein